MGVHDDQVLFLSRRGLRPREVAERLRLNRNVVGGIWRRLGLCETGGQPLKSDLPRGEERIQSKLTDQAALEIRGKYQPRSKANSIGALAKSYGVSKRTIWQAITGRSWSHLPFAVPVEWPQVQHPGYEEPARRAQDRDYLTALLADIRRATTSTFETAA